MHILAYKLVDDARIPTKNNPTDAGFDLYYAGAPEVIQPGDAFLAPTGCCIVIPEGFFGLVRPRSGFSVNNGTDTLAGVIDAGYTGEISVVLTVEKPLHLQNGDRMAQLLILPVPDAVMLEVDALPETVRGENGFGSSGK